MKLQLIRNRVINPDVIDQGIQLTIDRLKTINFNLEVSQKTVDRNFTTVTFNNSAIGTGACVEPNQILDLVDGNPKIVCLIYSNVGMNPKPLNPLQSPIQRNGTNPIQMTCEWYGTYPEAFSDFLLHEICHSGFYFNGQTLDTTHLYTPEFSQKQRYEYYLSLINMLRNDLEKITIPTVSAYPTLRRGMRSPEVKLMQSYLKEAGFYTYGFLTSYFGPITEWSLKAFQRANRLSDDGVCGPETWAKLKKKPTNSKIESWALAIQQHEGFYQGSRSYRNNNPANFKSGVLTSFMKSLGGTGVDSGGFVIFPSYAIGFQALCTFLTYACTNELAAYRKTMTLPQFFSVYAPSSDNNNPLQYAEAVARTIGVPTDTKIVDLLK